MIAPPTRRVFSRSRAATALNSFVHSVVITAAVSLALICHAPPAFAWGHFKSLRNSKRLNAHLVSAVLLQKRIDYCVEIADQSQSRFDSSSMKLQVEAAIESWLAPVREAGLVGEVSLVNVDCSNQSANLKLRVGPEEKFPQYAAFQIERDENNHDFTQIKINSEYVWNSEPMVDFKSILKISEASIFPFLMNLTHLREPGIQDFADHHHVSYTQVYNSTYHVLLHEMGHAFGLCDTLLKLISVQCDPTFVTPVMHDTLMSDSTFVQLTPDDRTGIEELFRRFSSELHQVHKSSVDR